MPADASELDDLRREVRAFLASRSFTARSDSWMRGFDQDFSRAVGECGWIGMTWPVEYGGAARSNTARLVLTEELLRAGAPVAAHWTADRQIGPSILQHGTEAQRRELLPAICAGEVVVGLGMSETEAGSDLAAIRTRAVGVDGGWLISGSKIWTTSAHHATHLYVLARSGEGAVKQEGLTEFLVDMNTPGITVRPILDLSGEHHFNEVFLDEVFAPDARVLGEVGQGWKQVTEQLSFERGGPERYLSTYLLLAAAVEQLRAYPDRAGVEKLGAAAARLSAVRSLGYAIAASVDEGRQSSAQAAKLKLLGTLFEKDVVDVARYVLDVARDGAPNPALATLVADGLLACPGVTIRGGASEIMRTVISRFELAGGAGVSGERPELRAVLDDVFAGPSPSWRTVESLGWPLVGVDESAGGVGGDLADAVEIAAAVGRHCVALPLVETSLAAWTLAESGLDVGLLSGPAVVYVANDELVVSERDGGPEVTGRLRDVRFLPEAAIAVLVVGSRVLCVQLRELSVTATRNLADEPLGSVDLVDVPVVAQASIDRSRLVERAAVLRSAALGGVIERVVTLTGGYIGARTQFGRPLSAQQAVAHLLADMTCERDLALHALREAIDRPGAATAASAAAVAARASGLVASHAHQLHGAIGVTQEHPLQLATRRLWAWRDLDVTQRAWEESVGRAVLAGPGDDVLWSLVTGSKSDSPEI